MSRILTLDIETSPHDAWSFNVWKTNILPIHNKEPTRILTWAAKFHGERKVSFGTCYDEDFLLPLRDLLDASNMVVSYNGDKFDMPHINREFLEAGIPPSRPVASVDLLKVVRKRFNFPHNRLDYVASRVLGERKLETGGFELWPAFMDGCPKAQRVMKRYNIGDVRLTERLYDKLRPWVLNHPYTGDASIDMGDANTVYPCPACDSIHTTKERPRRTRCYAIRLVHCTSCGVWSDGVRRKI